MAGSHALPLYYPSKQTTTATLYAPMIKDGTDVIDVIATTAQRSIMNVA